MQYIRYSNPAGKTLVASIAPGFDPVVAAQAMGLEAGTWEVISPEAAAELQAPTPEQLAEARRAEILARLAEIDRESIRPLRAVADDNATDFDRQKLTGLESEAAGLRTELAS
jgi:hypothetical protein